MSREGHRQAITGRGKRARGRTGAAPWCGMRRRRTVVRSTDSAAPGSAAAGYLAAPTDVPLQAEPGHKSHASSIRRPEPRGGYWRRNRHRGNHTLMTASARPLISAPAGTLPRRSPAWPAAHVDWPATYCNEAWQPYQSTAPYLACARRPFSSHHPHRRQPLRTQRNRTC
jgi:hypothetical protein